MLRFPGLEPNPVTGVSVAAWAGAAITATAANPKARAAESKRDMTAPYEVCHINDMCR
ncbi:hypothetical protein Rhe02_68330 [Rhizocola hellebori]|uniref:Uncharacterized protein n=1 Tax=Rhizocola hellebori TaxID=1392758 RepID=A0A8J3QGA8_9ACTN|nr:hypothetical protein Rhe02_68330 [Rhizocola hellebori]